MERIRQMYRLLQHLGEGDLTTSTFHDAEEFVCIQKLYHVENVTKTDDARVQLFNKCKALPFQMLCMDTLKEPIIRPSSVGQYSTSSCDYVHIWLKL